MFTSSRDTENCVFFSIKKDALTGSDRTVTPAAVTVAVSETVNVYEL